MRKLFCAPFLLFVGLIPCICYAGPFGLEAGMSRAEVIQRIGKGAIVKESPNSVFFKTAPQRSDYFDEYQCGFDQNSKLATIYASSKPLLTESQGEDLRASFDRLRSALQLKYGKALYATGSRAAGVTWMGSVGYQHPFIEAVWDGSGDYSRALHIDRIVLDVEAADRNHGFVELKYYFNAGIDGPL